MYSIGIDIGSTYTKYCVVDNEKHIMELFTEKSPIRQKEYFERKRDELLQKYPQARFVSCGYGRHNIETFKSINELTALALGVYKQCPNAELILDIGGQDTKIITQRNGKLQEFFINDKCAAGCGMFLANTLNLLQTNFDEISLIGKEEPEIKLSSICAVFAQSEIVELIAKDVSAEIITEAVIWQILTQAKSLLSKVRNGSIVLSGGLSQIPGIEEVAEKIFQREIIIISESTYLSAIGCSLIS